MSQGENTIGGYPRTAVIVVGAVAIVGMYLLFRGCTSSECDAIVRQTAISLKADVDVLESLAGIGLSEERLAHLSGRSEEMATALRACCIKTEGEQFMRCKQASEQFQRDLHQLVQDAEQTKKAQENGAPQIAQRQLTKARAGLKGLATASDELVERFERISTFTGGWEQEPNDQITDGNPVSFGMRIRGEFVSGDDRDYFKIVTPESEPGKVRVIMRKLASDGMYSTVTVYDEAERKLGSDEAQGKDQATFAFDGEQNTTYFVLASPYSESEVGPYELEIRRE